MTGMQADGAGERTAIDDYAILDTPPEQAFDDIVLLAADYCAAPVALVSLFDGDRVWFKARVGYADRETAKPDSICVRVCDEPDLVVIPDLRADPRTADSPVVTQAEGARFYAGVPLTGGGSERLGSLCILDTVPRPDGLSDREAEALRRLARQADTQLRLHRLLAQRNSHIAITRAAQTRIAAAADVLAISERRWRELFEKLSEGFLVGELIRDADGRAVDWRYLDVNQAWGELLGLDPADAIGRTVREVVPNVEQAWIDEIAAVCATGIPATFVRRVGLRARDYEGHAFQLDGDRFAMIFVEITDRIQAARRIEALLTLGDRLREAATIPDMTRIASQMVGETLEATRAGFGRIDLQAETIEMERDWTMPGVRSIEGTHRFADYGDLLSELLVGEALVIDDVRVDPRTADDPEPMLGLGIGAMINMPVRDRGKTVAAFFVHDARPRHWGTDELAFLRNVADRVEVGVARLRAEDRQKVLNQELSHRLKNTLAMVQAIAGQTLKRVTERDAVASFEQRLGALASAHDVLLGKGWSSADLHSVATGVLEVLDGRDRFRVAGPEIDLGPRAALSASLLLHELGTNAVKYGALSVDSGTVSVGWAVEDGLLVLRWTEEGGPPAMVPKRHGFGSRLINMGLLGTGGVATHYDDTGFSATITAPVSELHQA